MQKLVSAWVASNQTKAQFCQDNNIAESTFDYWRKKYNRDDGTITKFIKITPAPRTSNIEVHYPNGVRIIVAHDLTLISQLIHLY